MALKKPNYTAVPNALIDRHIQDLGECDLKVILYILRRTNGYHKDRVRVSLSSIAEAVGKDRSSVSRACVRLVDSGILISEKQTTEDGSAAATIYEGNFVDDDGEGGVAPTQQGVAPTQQGCSVDATGGVAPTQPYKEEIKQSEIKHTQETSPTPSSELDLKDPIEEFVVNASRRARGPKIKLGRKSDAQILERLRDAEQTNGVRQLRGSWIEFLGWLKSHRDIDEPLRYFLSAPDRWMISDSRPAPTTRDVLSEPVGAAPSHNTLTGLQGATLGAAMGSAVVPDTPVVTESVQRVPLPDRWNTLVPHAQVEWDWQRSPVSALRLAELDPEFERRFTEICTLANRIHELRKEQASWLTFNWLLKRANGVGQPNWFKLLTELRWMGQAGSMPEAKKSQAQKNREMTEKFLKDRKAARDAGVQS